jgi:error-prone DNA polymerase
MHAPDVNNSDLECVLVPDTPAARRLWARHAEMAPDIRSTMAIQIGLKYIKGLREDDANILVARRGGGYDSVRDVWLRTGLGTAVLERLAEADAFASLGLTRREALWAVKGLRGTDGAETLPLFERSGKPRRQEEADALLPPMPPGESVVHDYRTLTFSLKGHPVSFLRDRLTRRGILPASALGEVRPERNVTTAGLVLVRQRPGTASGVIFATLEDETGIANVIIWPRTFERHRRVVLGSRMMAVSGRLQREGLVIHIVAEDFTDLTEDLVALANGHDIGDAAIAHGDEGRSGPHGPRQFGRGRDEDMTRRQAQAALPQGRNFH